MSLSFKLKGKLNLNADEIGKKMIIAELKKRAPEIDEYLHLITWEKVGTDLNANFEQLPVEIVRKIKTQ